MSGNKLNVLIPWSGGYDSTLLLMRALEEGHNVTTFSVLIQNNQSVWNIEDKVRNKIREVMNSKGVFWKHSSLPALTIDLHHNAPHLTISQAPIWAFAIGMLAGNYQFTNDNIDEVWLGYKMNDCLLSYLPEFENVVKSIVAFQYPNTNRDFALKYPLLKMPRNMVANELSSKFPDVFKFCYTCETGSLPFREAEGKYTLNCGCSSCRSANSDLTCEQLGKNHLALYELLQFEKANQIFETAPNPEPSIILGEPTVDIPLKTEDHEETFS